MDPNYNTATTSQFLADALTDNLQLGRKHNLDVIDLHADEQDRKIGDDNVNAIEVICNSRCTKCKYKQILCFNLKDQLLNQDETQQRRVPRSFFMGPAPKNRKPRHSRNRRNSNGISSTNDTTVTAQNNSSGGNVTPRVNRNVNPLNTMRNWASKSNVAAAEELTSGNETNREIRQPNNANNKSKRQRSAQTTPTNRTPENRPKKQRTADPVADNLKTFITNKSGGLTEEQLSIIESSLMLELDKFLETNPPSVPIFNIPSFRNGVIKIVGADSFSADWIKKVLTNMPPPFVGAELVIDGSNTLAGNAAGDGTNPRGRIRRLPTIRFFIPTGVNKSNFESISRRLQLQNHPLNTSEWIAWKEEDKGDGIFYHVSVDEADVGIIREKMSRLYYGFTKIKVNLPKEPRGEANRAGESERVS